MNNRSTLYAHRMGINTYKQPVVFVHCDSEICRAEGFESLARIHVAIGNHRFVIATLYTVSSDLLPKNKVGLSEYAWEVLQAKEGDAVKLSHPSHLESLSYVRGKIYGKELDHEQMRHIIRDISANMYSDIHIAAFISGCTSNDLNETEILNLTQAMVNVGDKITWSGDQVVDKHCVGGLPGNRTTMLVVPIVAAFGLTIPKTSSRAITSPAGTADTMEVLAPVQLDLPKIREVVEQENGCIVWGGSVSLSPADDILIRVERALDLDSDGQLVASVLSKKVAAGSSHVVIDIPIGPTAKIRDKEEAEKLKKHFEAVSQKLGLKTKVVFSDGTKPIGRGVGPALEARDVVAVLQNKPDAPQDLRNQALFLAGQVLEFAPKVRKNQGLALATEILDSGKAWKKFQAICKAQGGMRKIPKAQYTHTIKACQDGKITSINNRRLATIAKLAGAPRAKAAGIELHVNVDTKVKKDQPIFTIHAEAKGELKYAISALRSEHDVMQIT